MAEARQCEACSKFYTHPLDHRHTEDIEAPMTLGLEQKEFRLSISILPYRVNGKNQDKVDLCDRCRRVCLYQTYDKLRKILALHKLREGR